MAGEGRVDAPYEPPAGRREVGEGIGQRLRDLRLRDDAEDGLRHDSQGPLRSAEERREVRELSAGIGLGRGLEQAAIRKDDLEARARVADTPAPETPEPGAPGIDRAADGAPRRIERDRREGESLSFTEVLALLPSRARFDRDRPGIGVERED